MKKIKVNIGDIVIVTESIDDRNFEGEICKIEKYDANDAFQTYRVFSEKLGESLWVSKVKLQGSSNSINNFRLGEEVIILESNYSPENIGKIGKLVRIDDKLTDFAYEVEFDNDRSHWVNKVGKLETVTKGNNDSIIIQELELKSSVIVKQQKAIL